MAPPYIYPSLQVQEAMLHLAFSSALPRSCSFAGRRCWFCNGVWSSCRSYCSYLPTPCRYSYLYCPTYHRMHSSEETRISKFFHLCTVPVGRNPFDRPLLQRALVLECRSLSSALSYRSNCWGRSSFRVLKRRGGILTPLSLEGSKRPFVPKRSSLQLQRTQQKIKSFISLLWKSCTHKNRP